MKAKKKKFVDRQPTGNNLVDKLLNNEFSEPMVAFMEKYGKDIVAQMHILKSLVRKLIIIRNQILKCLKATYDVNLHGQWYNAYQKKDYQMAGESYDNMKDYKELDAFHLWGIKKKPIEKNPFTLWYVPILIPITYSD